MIYTNGSQIHTPVSYTHLDRLPSGKAQEELAYAIRGKGAFRRFKQSVRYHGLEPVSYTHLDVYKRQGFVSLSGIFAARAPARRTL